MAKVGRPTKYTKDLPEKLLEYFDIPLDKKVGKGKAAFMKANRLPTVEGFCAQLKISKRTFHDWVIKYKEFSHALGAAKQMQMNHLIQHTLEGTYNAGFAKFLAMNISDYREKHDEVEEDEITVTVKKNPK